MRLSRRLTVRAMWAGRGRLRLFVRVAPARLGTRMKQKILDELQLSVAIVLSLEEVVPR